MACPIPMFHITVSSKCPYCSCNSMIGCESINFLLIPGHPNKDSSHKPTAVPKPKLVHKGNSQKKVEKIPNVYNSVIKGQR